MADCRTWDELRGMYAFLIGEQGPELQQVRHGDTMRFTADDVKESIMRDSKTQLETRIERLKREQERLEREVVRLETLPEEPEEMGAVVWFQKSFGGDFAYTYAAVRTPGGWYVTGKASAQFHDRGRSWDELLDFIAQREDTMPQIWLASAWDELA